MVGLRSFSLLLLERPRVIYKYALDHTPKDKAEHVPKVCPI